MSTPDGILYYDLHCEWCDRPFAGGVHEDFCRGWGRSWYSLRWFVFKRDNYTCRYCGARGVDVVLHCDHVIPSSRGGRDVPWNLVTACEHCNCSKGATIDWWQQDWEAARANYEAAVEWAYLNEVAA